MMRWHLHLLRLFWSTSIAAEMEYRINFLITFLTSLGSLAGSIFGLFLFYRTGHQLGGWTWNESLLVLATFTLLEGIAAALLSPNLSRIVSHVQQGTLDFVLLKPVDSQFWLSSRNFSPWSLTDVVFGLILLGYAGTRLGFGPLQYLAGVVPLFLGMVILYSLWFVLATLSIWFVKVYNATDVLRSFLEAGRFPREAYPAAYRFFFTFILPATFLTTVPAEAMLGRGNAFWFIIAAALAAGLFAFSRVFWQFAMRSYTSASS